MLQRKRLGVILESRFQCYNGRNKAFIVTVVEVMRYARMGDISSNAAMVEIMCSVLVLLQ